MSKRFFSSVLIIFSLIACMVPTSFCADTVYGQNNSYILHGRCGKSDGEVMLLIVKKDAQEPYRSNDIGYINTAPIGKNGEYKLTFTFDKNPADYKILTKADGQDATSGIFSLNKRCELAVNANADRAAGYITINADTVNVFSNFYEYQRVVGLYNADGKLIGIKDLGFDCIEEKEVKTNKYRFRVPSDTYKVKLFTVESLQSMKPYSRAAEFDNMQEGVIQIFVAPYGSDQNDGTQESPLATLNGARDVVRKLDRDAEGIVVYFRDGSYPMSEKIMFQAADGGTEACPITYSAYNGEKPEFIGGIYLDNAQLLGRNIYCIDLAEAGIDEIPEVQPSGQGSKYNAGGFELFIDDTAYYPARWPNKDAELYNTYETIAEVNSAGDSEQDRTPDPEFVVSDEAAARIASWSNKGDALIAGYPGLPYFDFGFKFNASGNVVRLDNKCSGGVKKGGLIYFYNIFEELDADGEYYIDRENKKLYFYSSEAPDNKKIFLTTTDIGAIESGLIIVKGANYINFNGITVNGCLGCGMAIQEGNNINIRNCTFKNVSSKGAYAGTYFSAYQWSYGRLDDDFDYRLRGKVISNINFEKCSFINTGDEGLSVTGGNRKTLEGINVNIEDCTFSNFGRIKNAYSPGVRFDGVGINIRGCTIHGGDSAGILAGGNDCIIENNEIYDVARECTDCGMIYLLSGLKSGITVRNNYLHDVSYEHGTNHSANHNDFADVKMKVAVYNDGAGSLLTVENNIIKDVPCGFFTVGFGNKVNNNIFIDVKYPIRTRYNDILQRKLKQEDNSYIAPDFSIEKGDAAFEELGYLEQGGVKNPAWEYKHPEVFTWKEYLKERGVEAIYPKNDLSNNLITFIKYTDYGDQIDDVFDDALVSVKSDMDRAGSDYSNIIYAKNVDFKNPEENDFSIAENDPILELLPELRKNISKK